MAYSPIAFIAPNYSDYGTYWLKAYSPGSTSPKTLSTDPAATTLFSKLQLNVDGFFKSAGGALITPHIEGSYDAYLFQTAAEAEANNTATAIRIADNITPVTTTGSIGFTITTTGLTLTNSTFAANTVIVTSGFTTSGDGGKGRWKQTGVIGLTPSQSPSQLIGALLTDALGNQWALINDGKVSISQLGGLVGSNNGAVVFAFNASSANTLDLENLTWPARDINFDNATDNAKLQKSFVNGTLIVVNSFVNDVDVQTIQPFAQDEIAVSGKKSQTLTWKDKRVLWLGTSIPHQGVDADGYPELLSSTLDFTVANWSWSGSHAFYNIAGDAFDSGTVRALSMTEADRLAGLALYGASSAYDDSFNNVTIASQMTAEYRIKNQFIANAYDVVVLDHNHNDRKSVQTYTVNDKTLTAITKGTTTVVAVNNTTGLTVGDGAYLQVTGIANLQYAAARITAISSLDVTLAIDSASYAGTFTAGTLHRVDRNTLEGSFDFLIAYTKNMGIIYGNTSVDIVLCNAPSYFTNNTNRDLGIWNSGKTIKSIADKWSLGYFDVAATLDLIYEQHLIYFPDAVHPSTLETRKALASYWAEWMSGGKQTVTNAADSLAKNKLVLDAHQELALFSKYDDAYAYRANLFSDDTPIISENFSGGIGTWTVTSTPPVIESAPWGAGSAAKFVVTTGAPQPFITKASALAFDPILEFDLYFPTIALATGTSNQLTVFSLTAADLTTYNVAIIQSVGGSARLNVSRSDTDVVSANIPAYIIEAATKYTIKVDIIKGDTTSSNGYVLITVNGVKIFAGTFENGGVGAITSTRLGAVFNNMGSDFSFFISNIVTGGKTRAASFGWPELQRTSIAYQTFAELQALTETVDYKQFSVVERASAPYILQPAGYTALAGDATFANGRVAALQIDESTNIDNFGTISDSDAALSSLITRAQGAGFPIRLSNKTHTFTSQKVYDASVPIYGGGSSKTRVYCVDFVGSLFKIDTQITSNSKCGISGLSMYFAFTGAQTVCQGIELAGSAAAFLQYTDFEDIVFYGCQSGFYGTHLPRTTSFGLEFNVAWTNFRNIKTRPSEHEVKYPFHFTTGSGTGNSFTDCKPKVDSTGSVFNYQGSGTVVGDLLIQGVSCSANSTGASFITVGDNTVYRQNVAMIGCQVDANVTIPFNLSAVGAEGYSDWKWLGNMGGATDLSAAIGYISGSVITDREVSDFRVSRQAVGIATGAQSIAICKVDVQQNSACTINLEIYGLIQGVNSGMHSSKYHVRNTSGTASPTLEVQYNTPTSAIMTISTTVAGSIVTFFVNFTASGSGSEINANIQGIGQKFRLERI
jgi:hypothetical protein